MDVSQQIMDIVRQAKKESDRAEAAFQKGKKEIEQLSSRQLDYFSSSFTGSIVDICRAVRKTNDDAYATFQALVIRVDEQCRPLLAGKPDIRAVKEVVELLRQLNENSEIETNFTGTINGIDVGSLVNVSYRPAMANQMIQKYWESTYNAMPGAAEEDRAWRRRRQEAEEKEAERVRRNRQAFQDHQARQAEERRVRNVENADATAQRRAYLRGARERFHGSNNSVAWINPDGSAGAAAKFPSFRGGTPGDVSGFRNLKSIVCSYEGIVGLCEDGTCVCTNAGKSNGQLWDVRGWEGITALAAGGDHVVGLREDGTCVATRVVTDPVIKRYHGQSDVQSWRNIQQIACGMDFTVGLRTDGTVVYTGDDVAGAAAGWKDMVLIGAGGFGVLGVGRDGKIRSAGRVRTTSLQNAENVVQLLIHKGYPYALQADGIVRGGLVDRWGLMNGEDIIGRDVVAISGGDGLCMLTRDGRLIRSKETGCYSSLKLPDTRLFSDYDSFRARQQEAELRAQREREEAERRAREEEARMRRWQQAGVCRYCGGSFKKGIFFTKCLTCGKRKDY